jgi:ribose transport system permease protein
MTSDASQGFGGDFAGLRSMALARFDVPGLEGYRLPATVIPLAVIALAIAFVVSRTVWGRWLLAAGRNESAARHSGVPVERVVTLAYVACSTLAGLGGMLFIFDIGSAQPSDFGNFYELYAIAAAVLGGCSLRGGEVHVVGVLLGAATLQVLRTAVTLSDLGSQLEFAVIGAVLLVGVAADELVRRWIARRRARSAA